VRRFILHAVSIIRVSGGIVIVPLNFVSSIRKADVELRAVLGGVRDTHDERVRGAVFDDTAYAVCSIQFSRKTEAETETETEPIRVRIRPGKR
jgi:hypothetical protein